MHTTASNFTASELEKKIYTRNYGVLDEHEQVLLKNARVTVVGAGGVGGVTLLSLARMGVGSIHVIDMDTFEYSNLNRQMLSSIPKINHKKAQVAKDAIYDINPNINVTVSDEYLKLDNAVSLLSNTDIIVDATDNLLSRVIIHRTAQELKIPSVWIAVTPPFRGAVMVFSDKTPAYELVLSHPSYNKELTEDVIQEILEIKNQRAIHSVQHGALTNWANDFVDKNAPWAVICPVANIVGIIASFEVLKLIIKRKNLAVTFAPNLVKIDLSQTVMMQVETPEHGVWDNATL